MNSFSLNGRTVLVTGSTKGIGHGIARGAEEAGATVIYHGRAPSAPAEVPAGAPYLSMDMAEPESPQKLIDEAFALQPGLDLLVCNAGSSFDTPLLEQAPDVFDRTMNLNVRSTYFTAQAFAKALVARKRPGAIVTISSTNGFQPETDLAAYDTSKGALVMLTRTFAQQLAPHGIRVNGVAPGLIATPLNSWLYEPSPLKTHYEKKTLLGRVGNEKDCAGATVFLLSQAAAYITGQILVVDGGLTVGQIGRM